MAYVETERDGEIFTIRLNRPERLNALGSELRQQMADAWQELNDASDLEVAILTGTGRGFCAGEDMKESLERGQPSGQANPIRDLYLGGRVEKPVIVAINGFAMGGGFRLVECADLRVAVRGVVMEMSEAKRWLLGGYQHGLIGAMPHAIATEMAFAFRFTSDRLFELGYINRLVEADELMPAAREMAEHLLSLPPASRVNTLTIMRAMRPAPSEEIEALADRLRNHGALSDLMESRRAFAEKRKPNWTGWDDPGDRARTPTLRSLRAERGE